jgi:hypothetical protein
MYLWRQAKMEGMSVIGFIFGLSGMSLAIIAWTQIASLRKEFEELKKCLEDSGDLKEDKDNA